MTAYDVTAPHCIAACDHHLPKYLRDFAQPLREGANVTIPARITRLDTADTAYKCGCGVPAHWFVLRLGAARDRVAALLDADLQALLGGRHLDSAQLRALARKVVNEVVSR